MSMKDHVGTEANMMKKHKKIFKTVNELNEWLKGLEGLSNEETGSLGEKLVKDVLKGEEKRRCVPLMGGG